jgi:hypothetical protein
VLFPWIGVANEKWHIDSHYPTQAKGRLEWGTQRWLGFRPLHMVRINTKGTGSAVP